MFVGDTALVRYTALSLIAFDVALRHALTNGHPVNEVRAGLTFGFPLRFFEAVHSR